MIVSCDNRNGKEKPEPAGIAIVLRKIKDMCERKRVTCMNTLLGGGGILCYVARDTFCCSPPSLLCICNFVLDCSVIFLAGCSSYCSKIVYIRIE